MPSTSSEDEGKSEREGDTLPTRDRRVHPRAGDATTHTTISRAGRESHQKKDRQGTGRRGWRPGGQKVHHCEQRVAPIGIRMMKSDIEEKAASLFCTAPVRPCHLARWSPSVFAKSGHRRRCRPPAAGRGEA
jgi:hypothetical protein